MDDDDFTAQFTRRPAPLRRATELRDADAERQREKVSREVDREHERIKARRASLQWCWTCRHAVLEAADTHCPRCGAQRSPGH
jgi:rubrerythrin